MDGVENGSPAKLIVVSVAKNGRALTRDSTASAVATSSFSIERRWAMVLLYVATASAAVIIAGQAAAAIPSSSFRLKDDRLDDGNSASMSSPRGAVK